MEGALQVPRKHSGAAAAWGTSESMLVHGNPSDERLARLRAGVQGNSPTHCRHSCGRVLCCLRHALLACAQDSGGGRDDLVLARALVVGRKRRYVQGPSESLTLSYVQGPLHSAVKLARYISRLCLAHSVSKDICNWQETRRGGNSDGSCWQRKAREPKGTDQRGLSPGLGFAEGRHVPRTWLRPGWAAGRRRRTPGPSRGRKSITRAELPRCVCCRCR